MGGSSYSSDDYKLRSSTRAFTAKSLGITVDDATFAYTHDIKTGKVAATVHPTLSPNGLKIRESRDSADHPVTYPIGITLDTTGSMADVPYTMQKELSKLMGLFLEDRASGKKYLGEAYPAIMISAVDDYHRGNKSGCLQIGQFESGLEIDDNLTNLWITRNGGGGEPRESYDLALYVASYLTAHDHYEKRGQKGCWFIIGDEMAYPAVTASELQDVFGNNGGLENNITLGDIIAGASELYEIFYIMPNMTNHYKEKNIVNFWNKLLPQGHVIMLADPSKICETIAACVALVQETVTLDDLKNDGMASASVAMALVPLSRSVRGQRSTDLSKLPSIGTSAGGNDRL